MEKCQWNLNFTMYKGFIQKVRPSKLKFLDFFKRGADSDFLCALFMSIFNENIQKQPQHYEVLLIFT